MLLTLTITFLSHRYHAIDETKNLDVFPPPPARLFQALIAGSHLGAYRLLHTDARERALRWFEALEQPPVIETCPWSENRKNCYNWVPNNSGDPEDRTEKQLHAHLLGGSRTLRYVWEFEDNAEGREHAGVICALARLMTCLGRSEDEVYANGDVKEGSFEFEYQETDCHCDYHRNKKDEQQKTERIFWTPQTRGKRKTSSDVLLTLPASGTLTAYQKRYDAFLRGEDQRLYQVPLWRIGYTRSDVIDFQPPLALFALRALHDEKKFLKFNPRDLLQPAAMVRHAMLESLHARPSFVQHYGADRIAQLVAGHATADKPNEPYNGGHFAFVPLPSINADFKPDGWIRRVLIIGNGCETDAEKQLFDDVMRLLAGREIKDNGRACGRLYRLEPEQDTVFKQYRAPLSAPCCTWRTITPVIMTGNVRRGRNYADLVVRALEQIGLSARDVESVATFSGPIVPKAERAMSYRINDANYLSQSSRYHVEIYFKRPLTGPLVVGRGRNVGFGLMIPWC